MKISALATFSLTVTTSLLFSEAASSLRGNNNSPIMGHRDLQSASTCSMYTTHYGDSRVSKIVKFDLPLEDDEGVDTLISPVDVSDSNKSNLSTLSVASKDGKIYVPDGNVTGKKTIWSLDLSTSTMTSEANNFIEMNMILAIEFVGDELWGTKLTTGEIYNLANSNNDAGQLIRDISEYTLQGIKDLAYDSSNDRLYVLDFKSNVWLAKEDGAWLLNDDSVPIASTMNDMNGIAVSHDGNLYGIANDSLAHIYRLVVDEASTNSWSEVGRSSGTIFFNPGLGESTYGATIVCL